MTKKTYTPLWAYIEGEREFHLQYRELRFTVCGMPNDHPITFAVEAYVDPTHHCARCVHQFQYEVATCIATGSFAIAREESP